MNPCILNLIKPRTQLHAILSSICPVQDGNNDLAGLRSAIDAAKSVKDKPSFIKVSTLIGYGSPNKADTHDVHGAPLGDAETKLTRESLKWNHAPFEVRFASLNTCYRSAKTGHDLGTHS